MKLSTIPFTGISHPEGKEKQNPNSDAEWIGGNNNAVAAIITIAAAALDIMDAGPAV